MIPDPGKASRAVEIVVAGAQQSGTTISSNAFGDYEVRHVRKTEDGEAIWIAKDVCEAIGISKYRDALAQLDDDERVSITMDTPGGPQKMAGVTEAGIWSLMLISRSPHVKAFKRWLTHEVLPSIRKLGTYGRYPAPPAPRQLPSKKELAQWVVEAEERAELAEARVAELAPPAAAWNELAEASGDYSVADAAKVLSRDGTIKTGERRLFAEMAARSWIYRAGSPFPGRWRAYQSQVDNGRLVEKLNRPYLNSSGETVIPPPTVRITPKGLAALHSCLGGSGQLALMAVSE